MPKRTSNSSAGKGVVAVMLLALCGAGVLAAYVKMSPQAAHVTGEASQPSPEVSVTSHATKQPDFQAETNAPHLLVPSILKNDIALFKSAGLPPEGVRPEVFLVNETLTSLQIDGARAVGIDVKDHLALVDFNTGIERGYGTIEEGYLIKSLQMALGQFKDIDKFQVVVEGKTVESLGNIDLTEPVPVIRPGGVHAPADSTPDRP